MVIISHYIKEYCPDELYSSNAFDFYFKGLNFGVLDIETTGLSPDHSAFILGGLLCYKEKTFEQYFVEDFSEEKQVLEEFIERIKSLDVILTYNGQNFDMPFIIKRAKKLGISIEFKLPYNLDLYLVLNAHSHLRKILPNLKQKTIENFMGLWNDRADEISGKESIDLYYSYLKNQDCQIRGIILLHNKDDVQQLSKMLPIIEKTDFHKAMHYMGFIIKPSSAFIDSDNLLKISKIFISGKELSAIGSQGNMAMDYSSFGSSNANFNLNFNKANSSFQFSIPLQVLSGNTFLDMRNFLRTFNELEKYTFFEEDFLIIKIDNQINYLETNHFIKLFLNSLGEM
ncbi:MAG: ribonuclease H-like domain-containing protein [Peptostreptococcaceae bacterium]|nr:ribonuclease H-like domain-containing protein [Peptostreptococcaceae bacterium]